MREGSAGQKQEQEQQWPHHSAQTVHAAPSRQTGASASLQQLEPAGQTSGGRFGMAGQATGAPSVVLKGGRVPQPGTHGRPVCGFRPSLQPELSPDGLHGFLVGGGQDVALPHSKLMLKKLSVRHQHCLVPFA